MLCISFNWELFLTCIFIVAAYQNLQSTSLLVHIIALVAGYLCHSEFSGWASKDRAFALCFLPLIYLWSIYRVVLMHEG
ncbi:uncharacterized protein BDV14DRAFT_12880 [Aspergillus stella-maris]|uniref:uncharacterized protein n=1 Tax=Aspergillus stella-maris TaxID=1810926 RepID=UPI003CCCBF53